MTSRRRFLASALALASTPLAAQKKPAQRIYRIGMLETLPIAANNANLVEFQNGLRELGRAEGQDYVILYRSAEGRTERYPGLAAELARLKLDVFVTRGTPATLAAREAEGGIPVVTVAVANPVGGDNVTGLTSSVNELGARRMELLKAFVPAMKRIGALSNLDNPAAVASWKIIEASAPALGLQADLIDVRDPEDLAAAIERAAKQGVDGLIVGIETLTQVHRNQIIEVTARHRLPAVYASRQFVEAGGLLSYGVNYANLYYRAAAYVDKILKGAKAAALPIERPTKFELVVNRRTARVLDVVIPPDLLLRSDEVLD